MTKKKEVNVFDWILESSEPGIFDKLHKFDKSKNRVLDENERSLHFMITNFENLNGASMKLCADISYTISHNKPFARIPRVSPESPYFNLRYYKIRFVGFHGMKCAPVYFISLEDDSERRVRVGIPYESCKNCGTLESTFTINDNSKIIRCAACLSIFDKDKRL